jgi:hypothetical protein
MRTQFRTAKSHVRVLVCPQTTARQMESPRPFRPSSREIAARRARAGRPSHGVCAATVTSSISAICWGVCLEVQYHGNQIHLRVCDVSAQAIDSDAKVAEKTAAKLCLQTLCRQT